MAGLGSLMAAGPGLRLVLHLTLGAFAPHSAGGGSAVACYWVEHDHQGRRPFALCQPSSQRGTEPSRLPEGCRAAPTRRQTSKTSEQSAVAAEEARVRIIYEAT